MHSKSSRDADGDNGVRLLACAQACARPAVAARSPSEWCWFCHNLCGKVAGVDVMGRPACLQM